ncbi:protein new-glue 2 [Drosophila subpulchrella]|uniref:protein new-glue 2 n=1 Tax=Drosophila subpulchrella TaxID=1486046 RepID=UPI0018A1AD84|nr:protein new-glue 2 [Drosophila subpulchrella]
MPISEQKAYQFTIEASNMKLSLVLFVLSMVLYVAQVRAQSNSTTTTTTTTEATTSTTTDSSSSYTSDENSKIVRLTNLKYSMKRKIKVATTTSSTKSKSKSKSARAKARRAILNAIKRNKKSAGNRKLNKKSQNRNLRVRR